jgi:RHS repeat-associated protein
VADSVTHDGFGAVVSYEAKFVATPLLQLDYTRNDLGRITQLLETIGGVSRLLEYTYDDVGRLAAVTVDGTLTRKYQYDANDNRTAVLDASGTTAATYDARDRIQTHGSLALTHNEAGQRVSKTDTATNETTTYSYDELGNLLTVALPTGDIIEYLVDGMGRRVGKKVNGTLVRQWLYRDSLHPIAELDGTGMIISRFIWADGAGAEDEVVRSILRKLGLRLPQSIDPSIVPVELRSTAAALPVYMVRQGSVYRLITDHLGSVRLVVDAATGAIAQRIDYDEWGNVELDTNPGIQPFGFGGGLYDASTGLTRFGWRDYDSHTARWTTSDLVGFIGGDEIHNNLFTYVSNDPINRRDPHGTYNDYACEIICVPTAFIACSMIFKNPKYCAGGATVACLLICSAEDEPPKTPTPEPKPEPEPEPTPPGPDCPEGGGEGHGPK